MIVAEIASDDEEEGEFYDAEDNAHVTNHVAPVTNDNYHVAKRRTSLPVPMKDRSSVSVWQVVKDFIGKDLSKIAVPVYFNEPLSFLQKFSEDLEYFELLDKAANGMRGVVIGMGK